MPAFGPGAHDTAGGGTPRPSLAPMQREQQARFWELRVAMSMARLWRDHGKRRHPHEVLASIHERFTEGFDTLDVPDAAALLHELA